VLLRGQLRIGWWDVPRDGSEPGWREDGISDVEQDADAGCAAARATVPGTQF
jgi:hypothetical protein